MPVVPVLGSTIFYRDAGVGVPLVFLHGNPTWSFVYRDVIAALRNEFRCVAIDYPGFGLSAARSGYRFLPLEHARVTAAVIEALGLSGITLVVHDWGGPIGLAAAQQHPAAVDRLVVANTAAWPIDALRVQVMSHVVGGPIGRLLIRQLNLFVNAMIPAGHRLTKLSAEEMAHYRQALDSPARREGSAVFPREITGSRAFLADVEAGLPSLAALPALIIWGDGDIAFGDEELRRWESILADHQTVVVEGAGHFVQSDAPARFAAAIRDWYGS